MHILRREYRDFNLQMYNLIIEKSVTHTLEFSRDQPYDNCSVGDVLLTIMSNPASIK